MSGAPLYRTDPEAGITVVSPLPERKPISSLWDFVVRGYRPVAAWCGVLTILTFGVVLPLARLFGVDPGPTDWFGVSAFVGVVFGPIVVTRSFEKKWGVTS